VNEPNRGRLRCLHCDRRLPALWQFACPNCGGQLALDGTDGATPVSSLHAGNTPLYQLQVGASAFLYLKDEGRNPTGSFKDRAMGAAVAAALTMGARGVSLYSCGNGGAAAAAAAAGLGLRCLVLALPTMSSQAAALIRAYGAQVLTLDLDHDTLWTSGAVGRLQEQLWQNGGWFPLNRIALPLRASPYYLAGCASLAGELLSQIAGGPGALVVPTGSGDLLLGLWLALRDGPQPPRLVAVQARGAAPLVRAWRRGAQRVDVLPGAQTVASGIEMVTGSDDALAAVYASQGSAIAVSDADILAMRGKLAREHGLLTSPEGAAAAVVGTRLLGKEGHAHPVVAVLTAAGSKYPQFDPVASLATPTPVNAAQVLKIVGNA